MVGAGVLSLPYAMSELGWYVCGLAATATTITHLMTSLVISYCHIHQKD
jgi:amino acid permease